MKLRPFLVFGAGALAGALSMQLVATPSASGAGPTGSATPFGSGAPVPSLVPCASGSIAPRKPAPPLPLPNGIEVSVDEGGKRYTCPNASVEIIDPDAHARLIVSADCPGGRLSSVTYPAKLPGSTKDTGPWGPRVGLRFGEWDSTDVTVTVTKFGAVGDIVEGSIDAMMSPRLNRDPVPVRVSFRAKRTPDRHSP